MQREQTIDLPPLSIRAAVSLFDPGTRTADLVFSTGAPVERFDWKTGTRYIEKLAITAEAIDFARLNAGAPLLDSHSSYSIKDQLGAVVPNSARVEGGKAVARVRFSSRDAVAPILRDVEDGIIRSVSVGYRVRLFSEKAGTGNKLPIRTAVDWEPFELSLVSMPADIGAAVRSSDYKPNQCRVVPDRADRDLDLRLRLARLRA